MLEFERSVILGQAAKTTFLRQFQVERVEDEALATFETPPLIGICRMQQSSKRRRMVRIPTLTRGALRLETDR